jgi:hypothetical protein
LIRVTTSREKSSHDSNRDHGAGTFLQGGIGRSRKLATAQKNCDLIAAESLVQDAFATDVRPVIQEWRDSKGLPKNPMEAFRQSGYLERITKERAARNSTERLLLCLTALIMLNSTQGKPYLAFDFGAESGRAVLAHLQSGILTTEEVHRFPNEPVEYTADLSLGCGATLARSAESSRAAGKIELAGIGVDAWGVDYALLGERGELLENPYHYRDRRTEGVMEEVFKKDSKEEIYRRPAFSSCPSTLCISSSPPTQDSQAARRGETSSHHPRSVSITG